MSTTNRAERIRELNDAFRTTLKGGKCFMTSGVSGMGLPFSTAAQAAVKSFSDFNADNDPYSEHDFGSVQISDERVFWKIDYYDLSMDFGSNDPADPTQTTRVLTIMLAEEY